MLIFYSELVSPRCQSRDSNVADVRCSSNDSTYSTQDASATPAAAVTPAPATASTRSSPQMELPLPATLPPSMAAYLNAANQLFLTNPLAAASLQPAASMLHLEETALDFSIKADVAAQPSDEEEEEEEEEDKPKDASAPLDLSCSARKRHNKETDTPKPKIERLNDFKTWATPTLNPYLAAVAAANLSPKINNDWKKPPAANDAAKALEQMTEMTRLGVERSSDTASKQQQPPSNGGIVGRHSAWQSHWLNKGAHSVKDVFKCVWCKQSFPTLATLTTHMKETKHCGVNMPTNNTEAVATAPQTAKVATNHATNASNNKKSDLNLLIKENMPLPRKLVRGQDVWLGKGAEQTRQILKCMWCGQSFRSLAEMTAHMQETQHYTNIISQEQIISWKSTDDKTANGAASPSSTTSNNSNNLNASATVPVGPASNTVSAVLTCKVCDQAFPSLKELSNHMVSKAHYKDPNMPTTNDSPARRGRQTREKRKKSLPVRKLLEMERACGETTKSVSSMLDPALKPLRDFAASTKITCEKCSEKIETVLFVEHIRQCLGGMLMNTPRQSKQATSPMTSSSHSSDILSPTKDLEKGNSAPSVLNAIEQLIEKSFDVRPARTYGGNTPTTNSALGSSILKRLGIDDNVDYTKPLMDAAHSMRYRANAHYAHDRSASESSSLSERCGSSLLEAVTPERPQDMSWQQSREKSPIKIKTEPNEVEKDAQEEEEDKEISQFTQKITVKKEFNEVTHADGEGTASPATNDRAPAAVEKKNNGSSLNALSSMFDSLHNTLNFSNETNNNHIINNNNNNNTTKDKKQNGNPLAALQKLCEKTTDPPVINQSHKSNNNSGGVTSGSGYSWDGNTMTKCAYCETSFYTKGAYKHHLQKVHFMKGNEVDVDLESPKSNNNNNNNSSPQSNSKSPASMSPATNNLYDESPQSKFRKYTELAKQLSSKNN